MIAASSSFLSSLPLLACLLEEAYDNINNDDGENNNDDDDDDKEAWMRCPLHIPRLQRQNHNLEPQLLLNQQQWQLAQQQEQQALSMI